MSPRFILIAASLVVSAPSVFATSFNITTASGTAQTLAAGQTGVISSSGSLTLSGSTVPVTVTGSSTVANSGQIVQTGTGRAITNESGSVTLGITNNAGALIQTANGDALRITPTTSGVTLDNYGTITSLNGAKAGSQAVDWNNIATASNVLTNYSTGLIQASDADSVRPGVNGFINNYGTIKATVTTDTGSDAIDVQKNSGVTIANFSTGLVDSPRHGITGGAANNTVTFVTTVTNNLGGIITGNNGSGINLDGFNNKQSAIITNGGTITGNGINGDGDGVDVDGLVNLTNTGIIRSINSFNLAANGVAHSEGITVGGTTAGGAITNSGTIEGLVAAGNTNAIGIGIALLGNDSLTIPGTREAIYGNAIVTNQNGGLIRGDSGSGILVDGPASGFTVTINNNAGATIRGGATLTGLAGASAAILTGADNDTINNAGTIDGSSNGKAISMGAGNDTLNITGGSVAGDIDGGAGTNALTINPGAGHTFSYSGAITNFTTTNVPSGAFNYTGSGPLASNVTVSGGTFKNNGGNLTGTLTVSAGTVGGTNFAGVTLGIGTGVTLSPGNSPGTLSSGSETWAGGGSYLWEINRLAADGGTRGSDPGWDFTDITGTLNITANSGNKFDINIDSLGILNSWSYQNSYSFDLVTASGGITGFDASDFLLESSAFSDQNGLDVGSFYLVQNGDTLQLRFDAVPEPSTIGFGLALVGMIGRRQRRRVGAKTPNS